MKKVIICFLLCGVFSLPAEDSADHYQEIIIQKLIRDFKTGVKKYNEERKREEPELKKEKADYVFLINKNRIHFSLLNYLNDQIFINGERVTKSTWIKKRSSLISGLWRFAPIANAIAEEVGPDGESTKMILTALGGLNKNLEEVGMMCFFGCARDVKINNTKKILETLRRERGNCNEQLERQEKSLKNYSYDKMAFFLHSTLDEEFQSLKLFIQKIAETNSKKIKEFMASKLQIEKNYQTCIGVMTAGTIADKTADSLNVGGAVLRTQGIASMKIEEIVEEAKKTCVMVDELKSCLLNFRENFETINSIKREMKRKGEASPSEESLPLTPNLSR